MLNWFNMDVFQNILITALGLIVAYQQYLIRYLITDLYGKNTGPGNGRWRRQ